MASGFCLVEDYQHWRTLFINQVWLSSWRVVGDLKAYAPIIRAYWGFNNRHLPVVAAVVVAFTVHLPTLPINSIVIGSPDCSGRMIHLPPTSSHVVSGAQIEKPFSTSNRPLFTGIKHYILTTCVCFTGFKKNGSLQMQQEMKFVLWPEVIFGSPTRKERFKGFDMV